MVKHRWKGLNRMANRLKLKGIEKILQHTQECISDNNYNGAVADLYEAFVQLVATLKDEDMDQASEPDVVIYTAKDCMGKNIDAQN